MNFFRKIMDKPWASVPGTVHEYESAGGPALPNAKIGLRLFLAVVTVLFFLLAVAYNKRMALPDWRSMPEPNLLWLNTAVLMLASVAFQYARNVAKQGRTSTLKTVFLIAGLLSFAFLGGQLLVWQHLEARGYYAATNPAFAFFFLITALHGLHILGGMVAWRKSMAKLWRGMEAADVRLGVELCAVYWHFLLFVWLVMFGLLLAT